MKAQKSQPPGPSTNGTALAAPTVAPIPSPSPHPTAGPSVAPSNGVAAPSAATNYPTPATATARATPVPAPVPTPTPPIRTPSTAPDLKKKGKGSESGQSPATPRPPSTIPTHLQQHHSVGRSSPVPPPVSQTPRPPSVVGTARSPVERPTSAAQPSQSHTPQVSQRTQSSPAQQAAAVTNPQPPQQSQSVPVYQSPTPNFQAALAKKKVTCCFHRRLIPDVL